MENNDGYPHAEEFEFLKKQAQVKPFFTEDNFPASYDGRDEIIIIEDATDIANRKVQPVLEENARLHAELSKHYDVPKIELFQERLEKVTKSLVDIEAMQARLAAAEEALRFSQQAMDHALYLGVIPRGDLRQELEDVCNKVCDYFVKRGDKP